MATHIDWQPGDVFLDHYRVERLLGAGGMGKVYRVQHRGWGMQLVVKVPRAELIGDVTHMLSFERECETWSRLGHHSNIVSCYFVRRHEGLPLVFAEYAPYGSLHDWISSGRLYQGSSRAVIRRILDFSIQFAAGLAYAHQHGVVHQDVKPANVMIGSELTAKVTDFGLARAHAAIGQAGEKGKGGATVTALGMTPAYCSPEQASHERLTHKSDLWSWAVSVMEMFTRGCHWMSGIAARDVLKEHVRLQRGEDRQGEKIPRDLALLLDTCFRSDPGRRPSGLDTVVRELQEIYLSVTGKVYPRILSAPTEDPTDPATIANANNSAISRIELGQNDAAIEVFKETELNARAFGDLSSGTELQDLAYNQALLQIRTNPVYNVDYVPSLIPKRPNELRQEFLVGTLFLEAGRIPESIERLTRPAQRSSEFQSDALNARGIALLLAGETAPAILSFETALALRPDVLEYVRNLAIAYYYHRDTYSALILFQRLAGEQRLDAVDAIRFAAVLSSAGQAERSNEFLGYLRLTGSPSAAMLCTACEVGFGVQSFLPDVIPAGDDMDECARWVLEALAAEPENLRAEIVRRRLPERTVLYPEAPLKRGKRLPPDPNDPEELADRISTSYAPVQSNARWGELPSPEGTQLRVVTTLLPIIVGLILGGFLFSSAMLTNAFGISSTGIRAVCWSVLIGATACVVLRATAARSVKQAAIVFCAGLPTAAFLPTLAHEFLAPPADTLGTASVQGMTTLLGLFVLVLVTLFVLRELFFRNLGCRLRVWGGYTRPTAVEQTVDSRTTVGVTAIARLTQSVRGGALGYLARDRTSRLRYWLDRALTWHLRAGPKFRAAFLRYRTLGGSWHLLLLPQFAALGISDAAWAVVLADADMLRYGALMLAAQFIFWSFLPLFARPFVLANFVFAPMIAWAFVARVMWSTPNPELWTLLFAAVLLTLNVFAFRRCPAFAALWWSIPPTPWDVKSLIDPLDLRRYAAPWRLIPVTNRAEKM